MLYISFRSDSSLVFGKFDLFWLGKVIILNGSYKGLVSAWIGKDLHNLIELFFEILVFVVLFDLFNRDISVIIL